ncbi:MAG: NAD(P)/FAD-dependent oxidoreductase [Candidatus Hydrogenedentota bacterium]|nr:MAG: NAD(P)/FAD-dependent oxidoreductase [Candidatus Hydrogenedentota bacterium]
MRVVIIGNGVAGVTTARHLRKRSDCEIVMISGETDYFFSRTALMYIYMGQMTFEQTKPYEDYFWEKNRIRLLRDWVAKIDFQKRTVLFSSGREELSWDRLVLALGSQSNFFGWPGQDLEGVQGLYSYQDLERMERNTEGIRRAVVLGGGLIGVEMAEMLLSRGISVTYLVRESGFSRHFLPAEESAMVSRHLRKHGVDLRLETELKEILPGAEGRVGSVVTSRGEEIPCDFVGITVGVHPNIDLVKDTDLETERGILVDEFLRTSIPDVYACGDCAQVRNPRPGRRPVEPLWYTGKLMGPVVAENILGGRREYDPGIWFNSARFFDIEYQVYGEIRPALPEERESLYWEAPGGERSIRIEFDKETGRVHGFNLMGIRYRQEVCHHWIREGASIGTVLENLGAANFDPEFFPQYEEEVVRLYNEKHPEAPVRLRRRRSFLNAFSVLTGVGR